MLERLVLGIFLGMPLVFSGADSLFLLLRLDLLWVATDDGSGERGSLSAILVSRALLAEPVGAGFL